MRHSLERVTGTEKILAPSFKNSLEIRFSALAACIFVVLASVSAQAADDIAGVSIGSSLEEAKAAISKANPNYQLSPLMLTNGKEAGVTAVTGDRLAGTGIMNSGGATDEFVALQTDAGKIWFVARVQRFDEGGRIGVEAFKDALTEKFGSPSPSVNLMGLSMSWQYDRSGKQWSGSGAEPCQLQYGSYHIPGVTVSAPQSFSQNCGKVVSVQASTQPDGMVPQYSITITDAKSMFDELAARDAKAEAERKQSLSDEKAKSVKPNI